MESKSNINTLSFKVDDLKREIEKLSIKIDYLLNQNKTNNLLSVKELCNRLGVSERQIRRLVAERAIPYIRLGKRIVFDFEEVKKAFTIKVK